MLLTIDIGTSNFKSALWSVDGNRLSFASCPLLISGESAQWLRAFEKCCGQLGNLNEVKAIVISGNGPTLVPVFGEPLNDKEGLSVEAEKARLWLDRGAQKYSREVSSVMGGFVDAAFFLPKILKIKSEENDLYNRTKHFIGCPEYLAYALTGVARTVFPSDGFDRWFWNDGVLEKLQLNAEKFPPFIRPGEPFGVITRQAAQQFGFEKDIPVITGGPDFFAAIIGAGITEPGMTLNRTGTSDGINHCVKSFIRSEKLMSYGHPVKPYWNLSAIISSTGREVENNKNDQTLLKKICYKIKEAVDLIESTGEEIKNIRVTGGMSDNEELNKLKAKITGKQIIQLECKEAELLGNAITGLVFFNKYPSVKEAADKLVKIRASTC